MDKKIICAILGNILIAFTITFAIPIFYAAVISPSLYYVTIFSVTAILAATLGVTLNRLGKNHRRRLPIFESALALMSIYPLIALIGAIPFIVTGETFIVDAILETVSDVTSAGLSLMPNDAPYIFRIWQSVLMWFGSLIFLTTLVTLMPEVGGCFGLSMSLQGGQLFSPLFGQMNSMSQRMIKVYGGLTLLSFALFKLAGLNFWDALLMAMRCISTGGGDFFPSHQSFYVEYAAIFSMLLTCGNFLLYYRLIQTLPPPLQLSTSNLKPAIKRLHQNFIANIKIFFGNSEVKACSLIIFFGVVFIFFATMLRYSAANADDVMLYSIFHVVSYISTTGINIFSLEGAHDFDKFMVFLMAVFGGCMGSVTGGLKMMRILILFKTTAAEIKKTVHPHMMTMIRVNQKPVPFETVGRILGFFFMACVTLFICSALLSLTGSQFSEAVAISAVCLTNVGILPGIAEPQTFSELTDAGVVKGRRVEIFAFTIILAKIVAVARKR